ncbi:MAG TPA: hypothetical protein P5513_05405 [Candidatus Diapherotrites archaeon]|nr:hypothetical protein [Candidatus Diapherotrites archaeon]
MLEDIIAAANQYHMVNIVYNKVTTGEVKTYTLEPYSTRGDYFFGYDVLEGKIKKFLIHNIISVEDTGETFTPRWTVEL